MGLSILMRLSGTILVLAVIAAGCASDEEGIANARISELARTPGLSGYQIALVEDGLLTFAEYEQAVFRTVDCLEGNGFRDIDTELVSSRRGYNIDFAWPGATITEEDDKNREACFNDSLSIVEIAFAEQNRPTVEELERFDRLEVECAREILAGTGDISEMRNEQLVERARQIDATRLLDCTFSDF